MTADDRRLALTLTAELAGPLDLDEDGIVRVFGKLYRLLAPTRRLAVAAVLVDGTVIPTDQGDPMANIPVAATVDNNEVRFVVLPEDDHNDPTADQLTWTSDDTAGVVGTLAVDDDTHGATLTLAHAEGTANITVSDPSSPTVEDVVFQVVVGAGATSQLNATATVS